MSEVSQILVFTLSR